MYAGQATRIVADINAADQLDYFRMLILYCQVYTSPFHFMLQ